MIAKILTRSLGAIIALCVVFLGLYIIDSSHPEDRVSKIDAQSEFDAIQKIFESLTLEEKIGQMLLIGSFDVENKVAVEKLLYDGTVGSYMLMSSYATSTEATKTFIHGLRETQSGIAPLVAVDQEGGEVTRIRFEGSEVTPQSAIATIEEAQEVARVRADELSNLGIHINFAPVLDTAKSSSSFLYNRTFKGSDEHIRNLAIATINTYEENGVATTIKHFPGHPDTAIDSHFALPTTDVAVEEFDAYTSTFRAVSKGSDPLLLMMGHILFPQIDPVHPASLSPRIIRYVRDDLDYGGVVITDGLLMEAVTGTYTQAEIAIQAVRAGNDILLYVARPEVLKEVHTTLVTAVEVGTLSVERIDASVYRILELKERFGLLEV